MQPRPTLNELLEAVRELLTAEIMPTIQDGGLRFKALIAANLLSIGERELDSGEALMEAELERLYRLIGGDRPPLTTLEAKRDALLALNGVLAKKIRAGAADAGPFGDQVRDHVRQTLIDQLKISNPKFLLKYSKD